MLAEGTHIFWSDNRGRGELLKITGYEADTHDYTFVGVTEDFGEIYKMAVDHAERQVVRAHELKTWCLQFQAVVDGDKTFEVRYDDRGFCVGDHLILREWNHHSKAYTGRVVTARVTYLLTHEDAAFGASVKAGYVVMSIQLTGSST